MRLEAYIEKAFVRKEHVSIFLDFEKAYEITMVHGILWDVFLIGLFGRLPGFVSPGSMALRNPFVSHCRQTLLIQSLFSILGLQNLLCAYVLGRWSVAYNFGVSGTFTLTIDFNFSKTFTRAYFLYYII